MGNKLRKILIILFSIFAVSSSAQNRVIPPSPEAASLGKYGDIAVNYSTGMIDHGVPLYTIQTNQLSLPISLQYSGGGIKVNETATWVGLGWVLNAGGVITRTVRGLDDEDGNGFQSTANRPIPTGQLNEETVSDFDYLFNITEGLIDTEPDIYYFNFNGYNGKFIINRDGTPVLVDHAKLRIVKVNLEKFEITTPDGIKYVFNDPETTLVPGQEGGGSFISSWYLTEIISPGGDDKIRLFYENDNSQYTVHPTQSDGIATGFGLCANSSDLVDFGHTSSYGIDDARILSRIEFRGGKVLFSSVKDRQDIIWGHRLTTMRVIRSYDSDNTVTAQNFIKGWNFSYSYLNNSLLTTGIKRLLLTSVAEVDFPGTSSIPQNFEYFDAPTQGTYSLPLPGSKQQDYWGYYNGESGNENLPTMIPTTTYAGVTKSGANRESGATVYMQAGSLKKINYPTGGATVFEYETNDVGGGFRLNPHFRFYVTETNIGNNIFTHSVTFTPSENTLATFTFSRFSVEFAQLHDLRCTPVFEVRDETTNTIVYYPNSTTTIIPVFAGSQTSIAVPNINLIAGHTYRIKVTETDSRCGQSQPPEVIAQLDGRITVSYTENGPDTVPIQKRKVGGLRIKSITNYTSSTAVATKKVFTYESSANLSSGNLLYEPLNAYLGKMWRLSNYNPPGGGPGGDVCVGSCIPQSGAPRLDALCSVYFITSSDMSGLGMADGYHIQYTKVAESMVDAQSIASIGRTEYEYSFVQDLGHAGEFPFPPPNSMKAYRGQLVKQTMFKSSGQKVQEKILEYQHDIVGSVIALKAGRVMNGHPCYIGERPGTACRNVGTQKFAYTNYTYYSVWSYLKNEKITEFDDQQNTIVKETIYEHNNTDHLQLTKKTTVSSEGETISEEMKYPADYTTGTTTPVIDHMKGAGYMHGRVIHSVSKIIDGGVTKVLGAGITIPAFFTNSIAGNTVFPSEVLRLKVPAPISIGSFPNYTPATGYSLTDYKRQYSFVSYDVYGNPKEMIGEDGVTTSVIWGYNSTYPVAEVKGLNYSQVIAAPGLNLGVINNVASTDAAIRNEVAKIRLLSGVISVKGYTYLPLVGMTSETDERGRIIYYEYDKFKRLTIIRDHDNNVVKRICYNYAGQAEDCGASAGVNLVCNNPSGLQSHWAQLTNTATGQVYTFSISATDGAVIGTIPAGIYNLFVSDTQNRGYVYSACNSSATVGVSGLTNLNFSTSGCSSILIDIP